jgi:tRNA pseudouridine55 synthase
MMDLQAGTTAERDPALVGIYPVDKPVGPSSFRLVQLVRRALGIKKTGHAGTLDPFASGLLIICAGRPATRIVEQLMGGEKVYEGTLALGVETDTLDREGKVVASHPVPKLDRDLVCRCLAGFVGEQLQMPPLYSALKHKGKPLYRYARQGMEIPLEPRTVVIHSLELLDLGTEALKIRVRCGKGTYIRSLAADIGRALGCGAHLASLRRVRSGGFTVERAVDGGVLASEPDRARELLLAGRLSVAEGLGLNLECQ